MILNKAITEACIDAAHNNKNVSVLRDDGRWLDGVAEEIKHASTGLILLLWNKSEGYKSVRLDRVTSVATHTA